MQLNRTKTEPIVAPNPMPAEHPAPRADRTAASPAPAVFPLDKREVFKQMVVGSLESGFLRYSKRKALLDYGARIGLSEFDAMLLIAEAQFYSDRIEPATDDSWLLKDPPCIDYWSPVTKLLVALGVAAILDAALICYFFA